MIEASVPRPTFRWPDLDAIGCTESRSGHPSSRERCLTITASSEAYARLSRAEEIDVGVEPKEAVRDACTGLLEGFLRARGQDPSLWRVEVPCGGSYVASGETWFPWPLAVLVVRREGLDGPGSERAVVYPTWSSHVRAASASLFVVKRLALARAILGKPAGFCADVLAVKQLGGYAALSELLRAESPQVFL